MPHPTRPASAARSLDPLGPAWDARLEPLLAAIVSGELAALSLDFFDTVCGRAVPRPAVAFRRLGERLAERGLLSPAVHHAAFVAVRAAAEERARRRRPGCTEVHLAEIYREVPSSLLPPERRSEAAALELEVESELAIVDPGVIAVAERARSRGLQVAVVSDTYFSAEELRALLHRASSEFQPDLVLTSSDEGICKADGLLGRLPQRLGVEPGRIAHLGDHPTADVLAATAAGLRAFAFPAGDDELRAVASREAALTLEDPAPDGGLAFLRRRAVSRASHAGAGAQHFRLGAAVFGPIFTAFAEWVVDRLRECGATGAACLMREGEFLAELVREAARARGAEPKLHPLWVSRAAAFRASISTVDGALLRDALDRRVAPRVDDFCRWLGVEPAEVRLPEPLWAAPMEGSAARVVQSALLAPGARERIAQGARAQRELLVECALEAAAEGEPLVLVDLGWGATIQRHLVRALRLAGIGRDVVGLYLAATRRASGAMMEGSAVRGFLAAPGDHEALAELVARSPEILEQVCTPFVGSVLRYERDRAGAVVPVLAAAHGEPLAASERAAVRDGIRFFQAQYLALRRASHGPIPVGEVRRILARLLARPLESEAALVGDWEHDENFGSATSLAIAPRVPRSAVARRSGADLYWDRSIPWPAGVAARGHPELADEVAAYALLGAFGGGESPVRQGEHPPPRYVVADEFDALARALAPALYRGFTRALARWRPAAPQPLRYRLADALNARLKRAAPGLHARAKAAAVDAIGTRGAVLGPAVHRALPIAPWLRRRSPRGGPRRRGG